ncbi:MAG: hypothetical protein K8L99_14900 [Anaerolineae bacterium]|nr:hypothetical protein [Anaerolineae bacterium]
MIDLLQNRTWRELRATARAHQWRFDNDFRKEEARTALRQALVTGGLLRRTLNRLTQDEIEALMALKAHGGQLVRREFCRAYGEIRRYRPWRIDAPLNPWRRPASLAEKLWFLGLIEVDAHRAILLPDGISNLLPAVPHPETAIWNAENATLTSTDTVRDIAALLGACLYMPVRPLHGRWLPPYVLKAVNQRLGQPENLDGIRSEFQCHRIHFLHYLVLVAGLANMHGGVLLPTAEAWNWLALPYKEAFEHLLSAVSADLHSRHPHWVRFKLPVIRADVWDYLLSLSAGTYTLASLEMVLRLRNLDPHVTVEVQAAFSGPLHWMGLGSVNDDKVQLHTVDTIEVQRATLTVATASLGLTLPSAPPLRPFVELLSVAALDERGLRLDAHSIAQAYKAGQDADQIARVLAELTGTPLTGEVVEQLDRWTRAATRVRLRQVTLLEAATPEEMQRIRSDWRLRPLLGQQLSPLHTEVRDEKRLCQRLARRGYPLPHGSDPTTDPIPRKNNTDSAYLWLALRLCQALGKQIPLPVVFPGAVARQDEHVVAMTLKANYHFVLGENAKGPTVIPVDPSVYTCGSDGLRPLLCTRFALSLRSRTGGRDHLNRK